MTSTRRKSILVAAVAGLATLAGARADARKAKPKPPPAPNADQQLVVAQVVNDTFPRPKGEALTLALCLDVQIGPADDEEAPPAPPPKHRGPRKHPAVPDSEVFRPAVVNGAPPELVARLSRPWRLVASAQACRLDPRQPIALPDGRHTAAQLVTVHLGPDVAGGPVKIDWTDASDALGASSSRDCTATRAPRGWAIRCGGIWYQ
jgi:hypothetical protein